MRHYMQLYAALFYCKNYNTMNFNKLKNAISGSGIPQATIANTLGLTRQGLHSSMQRQSMRIVQLEDICRLIGSHPFDFFDDWKDPGTSNSNSALIDALNDKVKLQQDVISLLREQLADCKARVDSLALVK
jgi:hypothetical protein